MPQLRSRLPRIGFYELSAKRRHSISTVWLEKAVFIKGPKKVLKIENKVIGISSGFDCFLAAKQVGETGCVIGVDMTPEMVSKARKNMERRIPDGHRMRIFKARCLV